MSAFPRGKGWQAFLEDAPERVVEVIEDGPFPRAEYGSEKLTHRDKKMGIMRYKGGEGRGHTPMKKGTPAVVYFDPDFCQGEHTPIDVPDSVLERHSKQAVTVVFEEL